MSFEPEDLYERSARFGEEVIDFLKTIPVTPISRSLIHQLTRSATSIGANQSEADESESRKETRQKIGYCRKESKESKHWVRMIVRACPESREKAKALWHEADELLRIFSTIHRKLGPGD